MIIQTSTAVIKIWLIKDNPKSQREKQCLYIEYLFIKGMLVIHSAFIILLINDTIKESFMHSIQLNEYLMSAF